jgi:hypothetical protein
MSLLELSNVSYYNWGVARTELAAKGFSVPRGG